MHPVLQEIVNKCTALNTLEQRNATDESCELIFVDKNRHSVTELLTNLLGTPIKQTGQVPTLYQQLLTRRFGGIRVHQKMLMRKISDTTVIAMIRPWRYGKYFTVKLAIVTDADIAAASQPGKLTFLERFRLLIDRYA